MKIKPLADRVVIKLVEEEETTKAMWMVRTLR